MQIDHWKLSGACRDFGIGKLAKALGITPNTLTIKLKDPTQKLYCGEFFSICILTDHNPDDFITGQFIKMKEN